MSQFDPTDLLCCSRREELTVDEQRRLREIIQYSLEVRLMSEILPELERESRVRPGDDLVLARINARALAALGAPTAPIKSPAKRRMVMLLVAAAVLLVAGLAGAWLGGAVSRPAAAPAAPSVTEQPTAKPKPPAKARPIPSIVAVEPSTSIDANEPIEPVPTPVASAPKVRDSKGAAPNSASEWFTRANSLRREGRASEAAVLYELLLDKYPNAREVGPTRLALAKYLQAKQPERALAQYRALAAGGGALRAEALWGISEVATSLGQSAASERALADLLREFPDSPYAEVARTRTLHDAR